MGKTTQPGYINKNNQMNIGRTDEPGSDYMQWFYLMECRNCNFKYKANGTDIFKSAPIVKAGGRDL